MNAKKMLVALIVASCSLPVARPAAAAPFCAVVSDGSRCSYYSYQQCLTAVGTAGYCAVNTAEIHSPSIVAPLCMVIPYSGATQCTFYDAKACNDAAAAASGVCLPTRREVTTSGQGVTSGTTKLGTPGVGNLGVPAQGNAGAAAANVGTTAPYTAPYTGPTLVPGSTVPPTQLRR